MSDHPKAVSGQFTEDGIPHGSTSLTPHLVVTPASDAIAFYEEVFGATVDDVTRFGDIIAHAELDLGRGRLTVSDPMEQYGLVAPDGEDRVSASFAIYVPDTDAVVERAVEREATLREPVDTFVSGDRFGSILDPFGVRWAVMTRVEDLSAEESRRRVAAWAAEQ